MKDQHKQIKGYRDLLQEEIDLMNEAKRLANACESFINTLDYSTDIDIDKRSLALGRTNMQQGFMWLIRSIAKPTTFG